MSNTPERPSASPDKRQWFVRMSNGSTFGPINTKGLVFWAEEGRIMPDDEISEDRTTWQAAQELPELGMETLIERPDGSFAGPFHAHAIQPLIRDGKIPQNARTFHRDELPAMLAARQMPLFPDSAAPTPLPDEAPAKAPKPKDPDRALKRENLRLAERVAELEATLDEIRVQAHDAQTEHEREADELRRAVSTLTEERDTAVQALADASEPAAAELNDTGASETEALSDRIATLETELTEERALRAAAQQRAVLADERATELLASRDADAARIAHLEARLAEPRDGVATDAVELTERLAALETALAEERALRAAAQKREALADDNVAELQADREVDNARAERLEAELAEARSDYQELLVFSNTRDAEYLARLDAATRAAAGGTTPPIQPPADSGAPASGDARRLQQYEIQLAEARRELEEARQRLQQADANAAQAARPQEPEIARIQTFADAAVNTLQSVLEQERAANEQARATSAARQEALHADLERLQRALNLAPGEATRSEQLERRNDRLIAKLRQELEAARRQYQSEINQAAERQRDVEQRANALEKREAASRDQLTRIEQRAAGYDSLASQLRRRENALLTAEREFETARQQWQAVEAALMRRIEELESGASHLLGGQDGAAAGRPNTFQAKPWMKLQR